MVIRALGALLAAAALSSCSTEPPRTSLSSLNTQDPGVAHVHGLGIDPADGVLFAATHFGLFRIPDTGPATRVAARFQDTMGFTVTGPNRFLGSGHPDFRKDPELPVRLGLISSDDAAQTWRPVSLVGEADFHALHVAHGLVYGWDATTGTFMVSEDEGRSWDTRATLDLRDFAVSPTDRSLLFATSESGLLRSTDGGATWTPQPGAPRLTVLTWDAKGVLHGVGDDGVLSRSVNTGRTWIPVGGVGGIAEAMTSYDDGARSELYVAVAGRGILVSTDNGKNFTTRYAE